MPADPVCFLFSRMNKLDRDFLPSVKLRDIAFILSVLTLRTNGCNNSQQCCVRLLGAESFTGLKLSTRTPNNTQQHETTCNRLCKRRSMYHPTILGVVGQQRKYSEYREERLYGQSVHLYFRSKFE